MLALHAESILHSLIAPFSFADGPQLHCAVCTEEAYWPSKRVRSCFYCWSYWFFGLLKAFLFPEVFFLNPPFPTIQVNSAGLPENEVPHVIDSVKKSPHIVWVVVNVGFVLIPLFQHLLLIINVLYYERIGGLVKIQKRIIYHMIYIIWYTI